jgi:hypothetical protein
MKRISWDVVWNEEEQISVYGIKQVEFTEEGQKITYNTDTGH